MELSPPLVDDRATNTNGVLIEPKAESAAEQAKAISDSLTPKDKKRTVGNILYDFGVFGSVAWVGVAALSALSAHEAMHGSNKYFGWLRSLNDGVSGGLKKGLTKILPASVKPETIEGYAKGTSMFATLGMGGNVLMAPIKWLEDNRQKNAACIDNTLGTTPPDPETIAKEPKQTWKSVFSGRMFSWGMSYVAFLAMGPKLTGKISNWFGEKGTKAWIAARPAADSTVVRKWMDIAAFDALFTVITATLTYGFSRHIARKDGDKSEIADDVYELNPIAPNPLGHLDEPHPAPATSFVDKIEKREKKPLLKTQNFSERVHSEAAFSPTFH